MKTIRIDKGFGNAKVVINTNTISEFELFNGNEKEAFTIVNSILNQNVVVWTYDKKYIEDWKDLKKQFGVE